MERDLLGNPVRRPQSRALDPLSPGDGGRDDAYEPRETRYLNVGLVAATARRHAEEILRDAELGGNIEYSARLRQIDLDRLTAGMDDADYREFSAIYDREIRKFTYAVRDRIDRIELKIETEQTVWVVVGLVLLMLMGLGLKFWLGVALLPG